MEVEDTAFSQLFEQLSKVSRGENVDGSRPVQFLKSVPSKDVDSDMSVRCYSASERDGTQMEVGGGLDIASCTKEFGRFITYVVASGSINSGVERTVANAFSVLMAGQAAAQSRVLQEGQLPKHKDVAHQP